MARLESTLYSGGGEKKGYWKEVWERNKKWLIPVAIGVLGLSILF